MDISDIGSDGLVDGKHIIVYLHRVFRYFIWSARSMNQSSGCDEAGRADRSIDSRVTKEMIPLFIVTLIVHYGTFIIVG